MRELIAVLTMGRSGSSMVAGCVAQHDVWTGHCRLGDRFNARGYFENIRINGAIGRLYPGSIYRDLAPMSPPRLWRRFVAGVMKTEGYRGGPALIKTNTFTWPLWTAMNATLVFVERDIDATVRSAQRHDPTAMSALQWHAVVKAHHEEARLVQRVYGGFTVHSDRVVAGDFAEIEAVLAHVGVTPDRTAMTRFVEPALWSAE